MPLGAARLGRLPVMSVGVGVGVGVGACCGCSCLCCVSTGMGAMVHVVFRACARGEVTPYLVVPCLSVHALNIMGIDPFPMVMIPASRSCRTPVCAIVVRVVGEHRCGE